MKIHNLKNAKDLFKLIQKSMNRTDKKNLFFYKDVFKVKNSKKFFSKSFLKKTFIIAEIGINHNGRFQKCLNMIKLASRSGADAVKIQTINVDESYHKSSRSYQVFKNKRFFIITN